MGSLSMDLGVWRRMEFLDSKNKRERCDRGRCFVLQQNGTLDLGGMKGDESVGSAVGIGGSFLVNKANASVTLEGISANSVYAIYGGEIINLGNISIGSLVG